MGTEERQLTILPSGTPESTRQLSPGLRKLLTEGDASDGACRIIALNATLRAECQAALPALAAAKEPATEVEALEVISRRMVAYGVTTNLAFSHGVTWDSYVTALEGVPLHAIEDAFDRWDRGEGVKDIEAAGFPPRPPQIALLAIKAKQDIYTAVYRARKALEHVEKRGIEWTAERKAAERQKMIEAGYLNPDGTPNMSLKARGMPKAPKPSRSQHEIAEELRRTDAQARQGGAPISRAHIEPQDVGDVI